MHSSIPSEYHLLDPRIMLTSYGHKNDVCAVDAITGSNMISCGFDRQAIYWKLEEESQLIFQGGEYSLDAIKAITSRNFITGSQDG